MNEKKESICSNTVPQKSLKMNAALNMVKTVMQLLFPLITFPYSGRVLGPVYIGKVNFAQSIVSYFALVAALGMSTYAVRESAKLRNDRENLSIFVKEVFSLNMISTVVAYILFALALFVVPAFENHKVLLCICGASILFTTLGMDWLYTGLEEFKYITVRSVAFQFISLVLLFVFVRNQNDYLKYAGISVVSSAGSNICNFIHARRFVDFRKKAQNLKKHLKPIFTLFAMSAAVSIYTVLDTTMLGFLKGDEAVGIYTAATKINRMVLVMITAAAAVLLPRLSYYAKKNNGEFFRLANKGIQFVVMLSVPCAAGLFILAEPVILLFSGGQYVSAVPVMKIMNAVIVFIGLSGVIGIQIFMSAGKEKYTFFSVVAGAVVNFSMNMILIPHLGTAGAACGTVCAEFFVTLIQIVLARKYLDCKKIAFHAFKILVSSFAMSLCVILASRLIADFSLKIILEIILGVFVYSLCLFALKDLLFTEVLMQFSGRLHKNKTDRNA